MNHDILHPISLLNLAGILSLMSVFFSLGLAAAQQFSTRLVLLTSVL